MPHATIDVLIDYLTDAFPGLLYYLWLAGMVGAAAHLYMYSRRSGR